MGPLIGGKYQAEVGDDVCTVVEATGTEC